MCRIYLILVGRFSGAFNYRCRYTNGSNTTETAKTIANGDKSTNYNGQLGGGIFTWDVILDNFAKNTQFKVGMTTTSASTVSISLRFAIFGFPIEYGYEI